VTSIYSLLSKKTRGEEGTVLREGEKILIEVRSSMESEKKRLKREGRKIASNARVYSSREEPPQSRPRYTVGRLGRRCEVEVSGPEKKAADSCFFLWSTAVSSKLSGADGS